MSSAARNLLLSTQRKWAPSPDLLIREEDEIDEEEDKVVQDIRRTMHHRHLFEEEEDDEKFGNFEENTIDSYDDDENSDDEDDDAYLEEENENDDENELSSEYSSSPSIPDADINFDLVYTLHSFQATVNGQASVKKGDALTLLDDSNSYWWLIRDLETSEVGYIPAENIETPFERLARLNKYRNAEISFVEHSAKIDSNSADRTPKKKKRVVVSTSVNVQLQILIVADNGEEIEAETYEEWSEEMLDEPTDDEVEQLGIDDGRRKAAISSGFVEEQEIDGCEIDIEPSQDILAQERNILQKIDIESQEKQVQKSKVIRVYAGNIDVIGATYHSMLIHENTNVEQLLMDALDKFHILQLETKQTAGVLSSSYSHSVRNSGIEYYITVKIRDNDEIILDAQDKPFIIHESLTDHLTTPMPSLPQFEKFSLSFSIKTNSRINKKTKKGAPQTSTLSDTPILQFFMHKRIKQVDDRSGQVYVKVSLTTSVDVPAANGRTGINKTLRRIASGNIGGQRKKKDNKQMERIDKMIAIPAHFTIEQLTSIALVKFHIIPDAAYQHQYNLLLNINSEERLLDSKEVLANILKRIEDSNVRPNKEFYFALRNNSVNEDPLSANNTATESSSISSSTSSISTSSNSALKTVKNNSKIFPEAQPLQQPHAYPVMTNLDKHTEEILKRIDSKLKEYKPTPSLSSQRKQKFSDKSNPNFKSPMSVSRNGRGIDIHLPHGILRSTTVEDKEQIKTQYSLMQFPNILVYHEVIIPKNGIVSDNGHTSITRNNSKNGKMDEGKSLSSLEDLEKELHRIVTAHQSN
ncbi:hypothetical protein BDF20DRAFT_858657 [Mycotypha africana]|uniref:uncharacterized protein n=1 Tax=Mycotypha africana TaxID=64632 RepID=UPI0023016C92|nr:uncharacterized protein BDF20DRAFT_858657 [Mycotypha africana]KAI8984218.1 hypothetical protein BDF20DRAFT_858657 [Mycotypha africana]